jgi:hypothetical protein
VEAHPAAVKAYLEAMELILELWRLTVKPWKPSRSQGIRT